MKKTIALFFIIFTVIPLLEGCWNHRELTDLAFVTAMGIDKGTKERYEMSLQIVVPSNVASGQTGGGSQGPPVVVYRSSGNNLTEASRKLSKIISRRIYYSHTNLLIISEEVAREGILNLLDALDRDSEFRTTTEVIISKNTKAKDIISTLTNLDKLPVNKFTKTIEGTEAILGENIKMSIDDIISTIVSDGKEPLINGFTLTGKTKKGSSPDNINNTIPPAIITASGMAIMKNGKLVGWLNNDNAKGVVWVMNKMKGTYIDFNLKGKKDAVSMTPYLSDTKVSVKMVNGKPFMEISVQTLCKLSEMNTSFDITKIESVESLEKKTAVIIKKDIEESIRYAQSYKADIFGFGDSVHRSYPNYWKKTKGNWDEQFANLGFSVKVEAIYREIGIRNNPFWMNMDK
ncbi:Ger(x)C family spore germination protein [Bacillus sp. JJ1764]|uniref:Ger(x)C family spore germination protein n=1 Tax=Bacillus sp. JJ1764 TaxID=3122964 RepID=UPI002FFFEF5A